MEVCFKKYYSVQFNIKKITVWLKLNSLKEAWFKQLIMTVSNRLVII